MNKIIKLLKSSLLYFAGSVLSSIVSFMLLPIYTNYLSPQEYGYYDLSRTLITLLASVFFIQIQTIVLRFMYDYVGKEKEKPITNASVIFIVSMLIVTIVLFIISYIKEIKYFPLIVLFTYAECFQSFFGYIARGYGRNVLFAVSGIIATIINAFFSILLIIVFKWNYSALYISMILGVLAQCIIIEIYQGVIRRFKVEHIDLVIIKKMIYFGIPFSLNIGAYWLLNSYSRLVISTQLGVEQNGIYAVATKFTLVVNLVATCFMMAWQELAFEKGANKKETLESLGLFYTKASNLYLEALYLTILLLLPVIRIIYPIFIGSQYATGINVIPLAIIATLINLYCSFQTSIFSSIKKNVSMFWATVAGGTVNVILVNIFITEYGLLAVNVSLISGFAVNAIIRIIILHKQIGYNYDVYGLSKFIPIFGVTYFIYAKCSIKFNIIWLICVFIVAILKYKHMIYEIAQVIKNYLRDEIIKEVGD